MERVFLTHLISLHITREKVTEGCPSQISKRQDIKSRIYSQAFSFTSATKISP